MPHFRIIVLLICCIVSRVAFTQEFTFEHLAGSTGGSGWYDGNAAEAQFNYPHAVAVDSSGNLYIADSYNHTVRKVTTAGVVSTLAGLAGSPGERDGAGSSARFNRPARIAVDRTGMIYLIASGRIRRITPDGIVSTVTDQVPGIAGSVVAVSVATDPARGDVYIGGAAPGFNGVFELSSGGVLLPFAQVGGAEGLAVDEGGSLYVATSGRTVAKVTTGGAVVQLAGSGAAGTADGAGAAASFMAPRDVAVDRQGNIFVADASSHTIRKVSPTGIVSTVAGLPRTSGSADGPGPQARFSYPNGLAVDVNGDVLVADSSNHAIRRLTSEGNVTTVLGTLARGAADGPAKDARFHLPEGIAVDRQGNAYVADKPNHTIRKIDSRGTVTTIAGNPGSPGSSDGPGSEARFNRPWGIAVDDLGNVYVADGANSTIRRIGADYSVTTLAGMAGAIGNSDGTGAVARFAGPGALAIDTSGNLYVADTGNQAIRKVTPDGQVTTHARLDYVVKSMSGLAVDNRGNVYVTDELDHIVLKIPATGTPEVYVGARVSPGSNDGPAAAARLFYPRGLAVDGSGNLFIADGRNSTIRQVAPGGMVSTIGGSPFVPGRIDGTGRDARFDEPSAIAVDDRGTLYVADWRNHCILTGRVTHLTGSAEVSSTSAPILSVVRLRVSSLDANSWSWRVIRRPSGSEAQLSSPSLDQTSFVPDRPGLYIFLLRAQGPTGVRYSTAQLRAHASERPRAVRR
jgi:sugar lactone lactonase YvrE